MRALAPTHAIVSVDENLAETADALRAFVPHVVVTHPNAPEDNLPLYRLLGGLFDRADRAEALAARLQREIDACAAVEWPRERVLYLIWKDPWMSVASDTYIARTLALVGWDVPHGPGGPSGAARYPRAGGSRRRDRPRGSRAALDRAVPVPRRARPPRGRAPSGRARGVHRRRDDGLVRPARDRRPGISQGSPARVNVIPALASRPPATDGEVA